MYTDKTALTTSPTTPTHSISNGNNYSLPSKQNGTTSLQSVNNDTTAITQSISNGITSSNSNYDLMPGIFFCVYVDQYYISGNFYNIHTFEITVMSIIHILLQQDPQLIQPHIQHVMVILVILQYIHH